jgi:tetratricopeptide (TPR) repeat protein
MIRTGGFALFLSLLLPLAALAQKRPGNTVHTRSAEVYLDRANAASRQEDKTEMLNKALEAASTGAQRDADNPKIWLLIGQAHARLGNAAAADSAFDKAEALYPDYAPEIEPERLDLWIRSYNAGVAALQAGRAADAIASFEQADRVYRGRPEALIGLGSIYAHENDAGRAEQAFRAALEVIRGPAGKQVDEKTAAEWHQQEELAATQLANLLIESGKPAEAAELYRSLLARQPDNLEAMNNLALALSRAGNAEEATQLYAQLLERPDLDETTLFNLGVTLYGAEQFERAADAFRRAVERNPHSRDALYNLGQALVGAAGELVAERDATPARASEISTQLTRTFEELRTTAQKLNAVDPHNRNTLMMLGEAQRNLAELSTDAAAADALKKALVETLEKVNPLEFDLSEIALRVTDGAATLTGSLTNEKLPAGKPVTLRFTFLDETGAPIAVEDVAVSAPEPEQSTSFTVELTTERPIAGWRYEVVDA